MSTEPRTDTPAEPQPEPEARQKPVPRFVTTWRNKFLCIHTTSYDEFLAALAGAVAELTAWKAKGVLFNPDGGTRDDYAEFYTLDPKLAGELGFHDERELYPELFEDEDAEDGEADVAINPEESGGQESERT